MAKQIIKPFKTKAKADAFCRKKNKTARVYHYEPLRTAPGSWFAMQTRKRK
jgi:hypothetical protein